MWERRMKVKWMQETVTKAKLELAQAKRQWPLSKGQPRRWLQLWRGWDGPYSMR